MALNEADGNGMLSLAQMRSLVMEALRNSRGSWTAGSAKLDELEGLIESLAQSKGIAMDRIEGHFGGLQQHRLRVVMSELSTSDIIVFGHTFSQPDLPYFQITEYGKTCLEASEILPYDPDGYLAQLRIDVPDIDDVAMRYLSESLECLRRNCLMATTVMLGGATEQVFILLVESLGNAIQDTNRQRTFEKKAVNEWRLKPKFDHFRAEMTSVVALPSFPNELKEDLDVKLLGIFSLIRRSRNDVGHPTGKPVSREDAHGALLLFPGYCKTAYALMDFFASNPA